MYLISPEYFVGKYEIENVNESSNGVAELLEQFIDMEVRVFMESLLGVELFAEFDGYIVDGKIKTDAPQKWLDLVNGVEYEISAGVVKKWTGLIYEIGDYPKSCLTNYIWCLFFNEKNKIDGNSQANVLESKNSMLGNAANQFYRIWNDFVVMVSGGDRAGLVSLNQFLQDNKEDYPSTNFVHVDLENRFL